MGDPRLDFGVNLPVELVAVEVTHRIELIPPGRRIEAGRIHTLVFAAGTALAMLAGALAAPLQSVYPGMGDGFLILSFIVVVIGGLGSIAGAFWSALLIGLIDTLGKAYVPQAAGIAVCALMAVVLLWRPTGLFSRA